MFRHSFNRFLYKNITRNKKYEYLHSIKLWEEYASQGNPKAMC